MPIYLVLISHMKIDYKCYFIHYMFPIITPTKAHGIIGEKMPKNNGGMQE